MSRTTNERLASLDKEIKLLEEQKKKLIAERLDLAKNTERIRLAEVGKTVEDALKMELDAPKTREKLLEILTEERKGRNGRTYTYASWFAEILRENEKEVQQSTDEKSPETEQIQVDSEAESNRTASFFRRIFRRRTEQ